MATVEKWVQATREDVWAILADPRAYAQWVVGAHDIVDVDGPWPEPGSTFRHVQGHGPIKLSDTTTVILAERPSRLLLEVRVRPFLVGPVDIRLEESKGGTCIKIDERVSGGAARILPRFVTSPALAVRNLEALRRLAAMAWTQSTSDDRATSELPA